ncbi:MAG TPA: cytochrome c oxidase accessory protein CcoG [Magnetospirillum sp.]|jgi:cytochrome c oxidase accessory protein FixG|nr:cytochrome c oxidase accessory protein CcoG [Magnetospirillum sp.]
MTKATPQAQPSNELYAETITIHPRKVTGTFRTIKWWLMAILLAFWHLAPFLRWDRGPGAPDQAILADMTGRRGYFFFIEIWPQEVYYLTGLLLFAAIALFFASALAGRVWCGFACWQTVYTDLFVLVERLVVGDRNARIKLDRQPWNASKLVKKGIIHAVWLMISLACGIAFTLYFDDAFTTLKEIFTFQASLGTWSAIGIVGGCCYLLAGFAREQVCLYMCPYSRFQSAMFDDHSLIISYEAWRGEPRAPARKGQGFEGRGHCIDCKMCVTSCPTGVDIREGLQMGCIGCGLCIDACNTMMDKFSLPRGLISYDSTVNQQTREKGVGGKTKLVRSRTILYTALLSAIGLGMIFMLGTRKTVDVNVLHERSPLFVQLSDGSIRNGYTYKVLNMVRKDRTFALSVSIPGATIDVVGDEAGKRETTELQVPGDDVTAFRLYVNVPEAAVQNSKTPLSFILTDKADGHVVKSETLFAGPGR